MEDVSLYFKVFGLGEDENKKLCYAGMKINMGKAVPGVTYADVQKKLLGVPNWQEQILELASLNTIFDPKDISLITPEEYERDYGEETEA